MKVLLVTLLTLAQSLPGLVLARAQDARQPPLTEQERAWLAAGHKVRARVADYPPYMLKEPEMAGLAVDYLDHIAKQFGFAVEYIPADITFAAAVDDVAREHRHYDLLLTFTRTPEREKQFAITADYLTAPWVVFTREDSPYIMGLESLADETVAVEKGFLIGQKVQQDFPAIRMLEVRTALDALMAVATGQADAYVGNLAVGAYMVKEHRLTNIMVAAPTRYGTNTQAMAVRPDWPELAALISKGMATMKPEDRNAIIGKWINLEMKPSKDYTLALIILVAASLVVVAIAYWNRRLVQEIDVRQRTELELRKSEARLQEEMDALQQTEMELQQNKEALQDLNITLEARLKTAIDERTRALSEAAARARESDQAKSAFLSAVSHDLRSPLHDILGYAGLLARRLPAPAREQIKIIQDSSNHLLRLINDILAYSRDEANRIVLMPEPLSLGRLAEHLKAAYQPVAERTNNRFIVQLDCAGVDWVTADEARLTRILRNLLDNAFKFTTDGDIQLRIERPEPRMPPRPASGADCLVTFSVSDTGVGIPASQVPAVFQPFQRLERHRGLPGVGLGLAIAQQYATAMGSEIVFQSNQGPTAGSTFSFQVRLPTCRADNPGGDEDSAITGYLGPRRTVLIADDQATHREVLAERCRSWGFRVLMASDGADALERFRTSEAAIDLVLVDQFMPGLDGWGLLHALRCSELGSTVPVMLISAAPEQRPDGFPDGMAFDQSAMKPVGELQLATLLGELLGLEWEYGVDADGEEPPGIDPSWLTALGADERERFNEMVAIGQVLGLQRWAQDMVQRHPEQEESWRGIEQLCRRVDLPALKRLAEAVATE